MWESVPEYITVPECKWDPNCEWDPGNTRVPEVYKWVPDCIWVPVYVSVPEHEWVPEQQMEQTPIKDSRWKYILLFILLNTTSEFMSEFTFRIYAIPNQWSECVKI